MADDLANRPINGGLAGQCILNLIPLAAPQIAITSNGPAITHSTDFSLVNPSKPAAAGEILFSLQPAWGKPLVLRRLE